MSAGLIIRFFAGKEETPFLALLQAWGGFTIPALHTTQDILTAISREHDKITQVLYKPEHTSYQLADILIEVLHAANPNWAPYCHEEVKQYLEALSTTNREVYRQFTKLMLLMNGMNQAATMINEDTIWGPEGQLIPPGATMKYRLDEAAFRDNMYTIDIQLTTGSVLLPQIIFRVMHAIQEDDLVPDGRTVYEYVMDNPDKVLWESQDAIQKYCKPMSFAVWEQFKAKIFYTESEGKFMLSSVNPESKIDTSGIVLEFI